LVDLPFIYDLGDASMNGRMRNNPKLAKQLMKDLLRDRYYSSSTTHTASQYVYNNHRHDSEEEYHHCHECHAWNKAIELAKCDLQRTNKLVTEFNLAVPSLTRQKMQFLLQNLVAEVTSEKPKVIVEEQHSVHVDTGTTSESSSQSTSPSRFSSRYKHKKHMQTQGQGAAAQRKRPTYNSAYRVYPRDADELRRNDAEYVNRQDFRLFQKASYNRPVVNASIAVTVAVSVIMAFICVGMVNLAKTATSKEVEKSIIKAQTATP
jgi:hypothetical protein